jgi:hypothetical protein
MFITTLTLGLIGYSVFFSHSLGKSSFDKNSCSAQLGDILTQISGKEFSTYLEKFVATAGNRQPAPGTHEIGVQDTDRWASGAAGMIVTTSPQPMLRNALLLQDHISFLTSIYNKNSNFCTAADGMVYDSPPADSLQFKVKAGNTMAPVWIRIQSYLLKTDFVLPCQPRPLYLRPSGLSEPPSGTLAANKQFATPSTTGATAATPTDSNQGLLVTLKVISPEASCMMQRKFSFGVEKVAPIRQKCSRT